MRPTLAEHACQDRGLRRFGEVMVGSTLPHLAEHLAIDLLVEAWPGWRFAGATTWADREKAIMQIQLSSVGEQAPLHRAASLPAPSMNRSTPEHSGQALIEALRTAVRMLNRLAL
ncbi:MAG: hypothetical protein LBO07_03210 [Coriobacteriales bacterium]|jgi:hypothetical protein|nr:hypothetical protein [Coriobacteriales bacterium]